MPEIASPTTSSVPDHPLEPHHPAHARALDEPELRAVAERVARVADGLALLRQAAPESAAVLLGLRPPLVERARLALAEPGLAHRLAAHLASLASAPAAGARAPGAPPAPRDPRELLEAARRRGDLQVLLTAAPESAAVIFGVHPDLVEGAREVAASHPHLVRAGEGAWRA